MASGVREQPDHVLHGGCRRHGRVRQSFRCRAARLQRRRAGRPVDAEGLLRTRSTSRSGARRPLPAAARPPVPLGAPQGAQGRYGAVGARDGQGDAPGGRRAHRPGRLRGHHRAQGSGGGAPGASVDDREHGSREPRNPGHERSRADDERRARRDALDLPVRSRLAGVSVRSGGLLRQAHDALCATRVSRPLRRGRGFSAAPGQRHRAPDRAGGERARPLRPGVRACAVARGGEALRHPVADRHGAVPQGRSPVHVRTQPVLVPARLDAARGGPLPGDRPAAFGCPDEPDDVPPAARERAAPPLDLRIHRGLDLGAGFLRGQSRDRRAEGSGRARFPRVLRRALGRGPPP